MAEAVHVADAMYSGETMEQKEGIAMHMRVSMSNMRFQSEEERMEQKEESIKKGLWGECYIVSKDEEDDSAYKMKVPENHDEDETEE